MATRDISLPGIAAREFPTLGGKEPVDYALFVRGELVGIVEAKKAGSHLTAVARGQSDRYCTNLRGAGHNPVFVYESTGIQTRFCDTRDPDYRSRDVLTFHPPASLRDLYWQPDTLRSRLRNNMPQELPRTLRQCQNDGIRGLEKSLGASRQRTLIHMAMGSGKTHMTVAESYRLLRFAKAKRILFLVDRRSLGRQVYAAYQNYRIENKKFVDLYNVQHLTTGRIQDTSAVVISTIQRLYSILSKIEYADEEDDVSMFESDGDEPPNDRAVQRRHPD